MRLTAPYLIPHAPRAFTLVELLVVVAICGALAALLVPSLGAARAASYGIVCRSNLRQIGNGLQMYANDNADHLPDPYTLGGWFYRRAVGKKNPDDPFSLPERYGLQAVLAEHAYLANQPAVWICPAASDIDKAYGNTYTMALLPDLLANGTSDQRIRPEYRDLFLVQDNVANRPYYTGARKGLKEPSAPFVLPPSEYRLPHAYQTKPKTAGATPNARRGAINVLFLDGGMGTVLYTTNPDEPAGPPLEQILR